MKVKYKLTDNELAEIAGRFARLKNDSKKQIGYITLMRMVALRQRQKATPIIRGETRREILKEVRDIEKECRGDFSKLGAKICGWLMAKEISSKVKLELTFKENK